MANISISLEDLLKTKGFVSPKDWELKTFLNDECLAYLAINKKHQEILLVDPKLEGRDTYIEEIKNLRDFVFIGVIDTHTHADHLSCAADLAHSFGVPLVMHQDSFSKRVNLRVSRETEIQTRSGKLKLIFTPGHTPDSLTIFWGPFMFTGDTILCGDTGRDDLPGGDPAAHYESLQNIKKFAKPEMIVLPGHAIGSKYASTWGEQLRVNSSLTQGREDFIRDASAFVGPAPKLLKESLKENFK